MPTRIMSLLIPPAYRGTASARRPVAGSIVPFDEVVAIADAAVGENAPWEGTGHRPPPPLPGGEVGGKTAAHEPAVEALTGGVIIERADDAGRHALSTRARRPRCTAGGGRRSARRPITTSRRCGRR